MLPVPLNNGIFIWAEDLVTREALSDSKEFLGSSFSANSDLLVGRLYTLWMGLFTHYRSYNSVHSNFLDSRRIAITSAQY